MEQIPGVNEDGTDADATGRRARFMASVRDRQEAVWALLAKSRMVIDEEHRTGENFGEFYEYWELNRLTIYLSQDDELRSWFDAHQQVIRTTIIRAALTVWSDSFGSLGKKVLVEETLEPPKQLIDILAASTDRPKPRRFNSTAVTYIERDGITWLTPPEVKLYDLFRDAGWLFIPQPPFLAGDDIDRRPDFLLFWQHRARCAVLIEVDSDAFHPPSQREDDERKERLFQARGFEYVRFSAKRCLTNPASVLREITEFCTRKFGA
jgi:hypothetical protein